MTIAKEEIMKAQTQEQEFMNLYMLAREAALVLDQNNDEETVASVSSAQSEKATSRAGKWEEMFQRLSMYREKTGNCLVPAHYEEDLKLGYWVADQRQKFKSGSKCVNAMNLERKTKLNSIGFEWNAVKYKRSTWQTRFEQLLEFVVENGHAHVPIGWVKNLQLSRWVSGLRRARKTAEKRCRSDKPNQSSRKSGSLYKVSQECIDLLNSVGFVWECQRGRIKRQRSGCNVPLPKPFAGKSLPANILQKRARDLLRRYRDSGNASVKSDQMSFVAGVEVHSSAIQKSSKESCLAQDAIKGGKLKIQCLSEEFKSDNLPADTSVMKCGPDGECKPDENVSSNVSHPVISNDQHSQSDSMRNPDAVTSSPMPHPHSNAFSWNPYKQGEIYYQAVPVSVCVPFSSSPMFQMPSYGVPMNFQQAITWLPVPVDTSMTKPTPHTSVLKC